MKKWTEQQYRKEYKWWLFFIGLILLIPAIFKKVSLSDLIIAETGLMIFWYSLETYNLKKVNQKTLKETRRSLYLTMRPFIRLQWSDYDSYSNSKGYWNIKIINEGEGTALNVRLYFSHNKTVVYRSVIAGHKTYLPITQENYKDLGYKDESDFVKGFSPEANNYNISISYLDIAGQKYSQTFVTDFPLNDHYRLVSLGIPEELLADEVKMRPLKL